MPIHEKLTEQIEQLLTSKGIATGNLEEFLNTVDEAYRHFEEDRRQLKTSIDSTTQQLIKGTVELKEQLAKVTQTEKELRESNALLSSTLNSTQDAVLVVDNDNRLVIYNRNVLDIFGVSDSYLESQFNAGFLPLLQDYITNMGDMEREFQFVKNNPKTTTSSTIKFNDGRIFDCYSKPHLDNIDQVVGRVWSLHDITELKRSEQEAIFHAYHDSLTGLPNRSLFYDRLSHAILNHRRSRKKLAVLYLDLDGFKYINDSMGHQLGDHLLQMVAKRITTYLRAQDSMARQGGDEYIILLEGLVGSADVTMIANRIVATFREPFALDNQEIHITTSIGISLYPNDSKQADTLIRNADMAMYHAKSQGRNNYQFFSQELARLSMHRLTMQNNLQQAIEQREFSIVYQPKVCYKTGRIIAAEALIRWHQDVGKVIPPLDFIPFAEDNGLIIPISEWLILSVAKQVKEWLLLGFDDFSVAVNISAVHFQRGDVVKTFMDAIRDAGIAAKNIELEITEGVIMNNMENTANILAEFNQRGIKTAIDDFGTGYSSLNYLKHLPITYLKIDKSFIDGLVKSKEDVALVSSIISLAHILKVQVVAEGVETKECEQILIEHNCDFGQGYLYSKPVSPEKIAELLEEQRKKLAN